MNSFKNMMRLAQDRVFQAALLLFAISALVACSNTVATPVEKGTAATTVAASTSTASASTAGDLAVVEFLPPPISDGGQVQSTIAENDLLAVDVFQVDELDREVRVEANGIISMPLIGQIKAAGKTATQLETDLEQAYGRNYLQSPEITVFVKESFGQRVTLDGEFRKPGIYPVTTQTTLLQLVAQAGGITDLADEKKLFVYREYPGQKRVANYSLKDIRTGEKNDPRLYGGDVVVAFTSDTKVAAKNLREALGLVSSAARVATPF